MWVDFEICKFKLNYLLYNNSLIFWNSLGTFLSASEDLSGVLYSIEQKIARATMIPREHGEVSRLWSSHL